MTATPKNLEQQDSKPRNASLVEWRTQWNCSYETLLWGMTHDSSSYFPAVSFQRARNSGRETSFQAYPPVKYTSWCVSTTYYTIPRLQIISFLFSGWRLLWKQLRLALFTWPQPNPDQSIEKKWDIRMLSKSMKALTAYWAYWCWWAVESPSPSSPLRMRGSRCGRLHRPRDAGHTLVTTVNWNKSVPIGHLLFVLLLLPL